MAAAAAAPASPAVLDSLPGLAQLFRQDCANDALCTALGARQVRWDQLPSACPAAPQDVWSALRAAQLSCRTLHRWVQTPGLVSTVTLTFPPLTCCSPGSLAALHPHAAYASVFLTWCVLVQTINCMSRLEAGLVAHHAGVKWTDK